jgi:hypothetical protein
MLLLPLASIITIGKAYRLFLQKIGLLVQKLPQVLNTQKLLPYVA